jgi:hypothetical protein
VRGCEEVKARLEPEPSAARDHIGSLRLDLVERLVVHDVDSVTPTFALTGPDQLPESARAGSEDPALASAGEMFACHAPGLS